MTYIEKMKQALEEVDKEAKECFNKRYGIESGRYFKASVVAKEVGISNQQVYDQCQYVVERILYLAQKQVHTCTVLVSYLQGKIQREKIDETYKKLLHFCQKECNHLPLKESVNLISSFLFPLSQTQTFLERLKMDQQKEHTFEELLSDVIWQHKKEVSSTFLASIKEKRSAVVYDPILLQERKEGNVFQFVRGKKGYFQSKKMNQTIAFESSLEKNMLEKMEQNVNVVRYIPQPFEIPYQKNGKWHTYYPDFFVLLRNGMGFIMEIKHGKDMGYFSNILKWKAMQNFCKKHGLGFLITDSFKSIQCVKNTHYRRYLKEEIVDYLNDPFKTTDWFKQEIMKKQEVTKEELAILALKEGLKYDAKHFFIK